MKKLILLGLAFALLTVFSSIAQKKAEVKKPVPSKEVKMEEVAILHTKLGNIVIRFFPEKAPNHVKNFLELSKSGFYNGTRFHRAIPKFMIQGGDPNTKTNNKASWGQGGNGNKNLKAEFNDISHKRGIVSMARAQDPDSASSQFFICIADSTFLDNKYTVFGEVVEGMDVADKIVNAPKEPKTPDNPEGSRPIDPVSIDKVTVEKRPVQ